MLLMSSYIQKLKGMPLQRINRPNLRLALTESNAWQTSKTPSALAIHQKLPGKAYFLLMMFIQQEQRQMNAQRFY